MAFPWMAAAGGVSALSSMFGDDDPEMPEEMKRLYRLARRLYKERLAFAKGIPGSAPGEQAAIAQAKGLAGQQMGNAYQEFLAARGARGPVSGSDADASRIFGESQAGNLMNIDMGMMAQFLQNRENVYGQLPGILGAAGGAASSGFAAGRSAGGGFDPMQALSAAAYEYGLGKGSAPKSTAIKPPASGVQYTPPDFAGNEEWWKRRERPRGPSYSYYDQDPESYF